MLFAKVPHHLSEELPKDRPYTRLEAWFQYDMDAYISKTRSEREYSRMWTWGRDKVARFISEIRSKSEENLLPIVTQNSQPKARQRPAKDQPPKPLRNGMLQLVTSHPPASDQPNTSQLFIRENKREETLSLSDLWNEVVTGILPTVHKPVSKDRQKKCDIRLKERSFPEWEEIFRLMITTQFLCGNNDRGWKADFDWIIANDGNAGKVLEGKYEKVGGRAVSNDTRYSTIFAGV